MYNTILTTVQDQRNPHTLKAALKKHKLSERSFRRRNLIAELHIVDEQRLQTILQNLVRKSKSTRVGMERLNILCGMALQEDGLAEDRRAAVADGRLI